MQNIKQRPISFVLIFFLACSVFRVIEYFVIRTDQSIIGEAFIHKLIGIALLAIAVGFLHYRWRDIGFETRGMIRNLCIGVLLGGGAYTVAYTVETLMQISAGNAPFLDFYATSYAIQGNRGIQDGFVFILICVVGNIINVVMEEGIFRGLFVKVLGEKHTFLKACMLSSVLFGLWHIAQPLRNMFDGEQSPMGALMSAILLVVTSALGGIQYCMLYKLTNSLWAGMAAHFINNASVNLVHIITASGADELQTLRITIAQTLSFSIVLVFLLKHHFFKKTS